MANKKKPKEKHCKQTSRLCMRKILTWTQHSLHINFNYLTLKILFVISYVLSGHEKGYYSEKGILFEAPTLSKKGSSYHSFSIYLLERFSKICQLKLLFKYNRVGRSVTCGKFFLRTTKTPCFWIVWDSLKTILIELSTPDPSSIRDALKTTRSVSYLLYSSWILSMFVIGDHSVRQHSLCSFARLFLSMYSKYLYCHRI